MTDLGFWGPFMGGVSTGTILTYAAMRTKTASSVPSPRPAARPAPAQPQRNITVHNILAPRQKPQPEHFIDLASVNRTPIKPPVERRLLLK